MEPDDIVMLVKCGVIATLPVDDWPQPVISETARTELLAIT